MDEYRDPLKILEYVPDGRRRRGRPRRGYLHYMDELCRKRGKDHFQTRSLARNRKEWQSWLDHAVMHTRRTVKEKEVYNIISKLICKNTKEYVPTLSRFMKRFAEYMKKFNVILALEKEFICRHILSFYLSFALCF